MRERENIPQASFSDLVAAAWADFPSIEALRSGMVSDVAREPF